MHVLEAMEVELFDLYEMRNEVFDFGESSRDLQHAYQPSRNSAKDL